MIFGFDDNGGYVLAAYIAVMVLLAVYATVVLVRGRRLSKRVPPEDRRWL
jgi:hypothetical protein